MIHAFTFHTPNHCFRPLHRWMAGSAEQINFSFSPPDMKQWRMLESVYSIIWFFFFSFQSFVRFVLFIIEHKCTMTQVRTINGFKPRIFKFLWTRVPAILGVCWKVKIIHISTFRCIDIILLHIWIISNKKCIHLTSHRVAFAGCSFSNDMQTFLCEFCIRFNCADFTHFT